MILARCRAFKKGGCGLISADAITHKSAIRLVIEVSIFRVKYAIEERMRCEFKRLPILAGVTGPSYAAFFP
jgi:hypothetical protein